MPDFVNKWQKSRQEPLGSRIRESIVKPPPLKPKLEEAQRSISSQVNKIDKRIEHLKSKESGLFNKVVSSMQAHDIEHANAYSSELSEIRKAITQVTASKLILEQVNLRIGTVTQYGDIVATLGPVVPVVRSIRKGLTGVMPEASSEIAEIGSLLGSLVTDAGTLSGMTINFEPNSEDAEKILSEAKVVAEAKVAERLPLIPDMEPAAKEST